MSQIVLLVSKNNNDMKHVGHFASYMNTGWTTIHYYDVKDAIDHLESICKRLDFTVPANIGIITDLELNFLDSEGPYGLVIQGIAHFKNIPCVICASQNIQDQWAKKVNDDLGFPPLLAHVGEMRKWMEVIRQLSLRMSPA